MWLQVTIRPLGPYHIGATQVSGIAEIGPAKALPLPMPSTVIGALGAATGTPMGQDPFEAMQCEQIWGPLVRIRGQDHFPAGTALIPTAKLRDYTCLAIDEPPAAKLEYRYELVARARIGVQLGEAKTVQHMYQAEYVWVREVGGRGLEPGELEITYLAKCRRLGRGRWVARLGGEARLAIIEVAEGGEPRPCRGPAVLLSPLLFHAQGPTTRIDRAEGLRNVERVYGLPSIEDGEVKPPTKIRTTYVGLGFHIGKRERRAYMQALPQGTVVEVAEPAITAGLHGERGYGSLLCP